MTQEIKPRSLEYIKKLGNQILDSNDLKSLNRSLELKPLCLLQNCYDLERFVYNLITPVQRKAILDHIKNLSKDQPIEPHIFTTAEYAKQLSMVELDWITVLSNTPESFEYSMRSRLPQNTNVISEIPEYYESSDENIPIPDELDDELESVSQFIFQKIRNYCHLFPNFRVIYIDRSSPVSIRVSDKLWERTKKDPSFVVLGTFLQGSAKKKYKNINHFNNRADLLALISKQLNNMT